jgi:hypothetical protein
MAAVAELSDPFARHGLTILRGTGLRLGELLDLELDCLLDFASHGSWLKVPLGKLGTERTVPWIRPLCSRWTDGPPSAAPNAPCRIPATTCPPTSCSSSTGTGSRPTGSDKD